MPKRNILKLATNIPVRGTIEKAWYQASTREGYADQIALDGTWNGDPNAKIYTTLRVAEQLASLGIIEAYEWEGEPRYRVLDTQTEVQLLKTEEGTKKYINATIADGREAGDTPAPKTAGGTSKSPPTAPPSSTGRDDYWKRQASAMKRAWDAAGWVLKDTTFMPGEESAAAIEATERIAVSLYIQANHDGAV